MARDFFLPTPHSVLISVVLIFGTSSILSAQDQNPYAFVLNGSRIDGYDKILQLDFSSPNISALHTPQDVYVASLANFCHIVFTGDKKGYEQRKYAEKEYLSLLASMNESEELVNFVTSEVRLHWAIIKIMQGEMLQGIWELRQSIAIAKRNMSSYPEYIPQLKTMACLHLLLGSLPEKHQWLIPIMGIKPNISLGLEMLQTVREKTYFFREEATIIESISLSYLFNNSTEAFKSIQNLLDDESASLLTYYAAISICQKSGNAALSLRYIDHILTTLKKTGTKPIPAIYYFKGEASLQLEDYIKSIAAYSLFIKENLSEDLLKDAWFKISIANLLHGNNSLAEFYFNKANVNGNTQTEADKNAHIILQKGILPDSTLIKTRMLFDGGNYQKALQVLKNAEVKNRDNDWLAEYHYRIGRIYQKLNKVSLAKENLIKSTEITASKELYFAANACLELGLMAKQAADKSNAQYWLKKSMEYKGHPYTQSIASKASRALNEL
ncbi:MAG: tol-pal system YbgF family protein [Cyclobacteriaceae bacterium]